ncbi:MAG TPA: hypothetical protein VK968_14050, partial [Roseimicrobium sp.]|nr:hypothetical protein [Roseimicrobium sp.]
PALQDPGARLCPVRRISRSGILRRVGVKRYERVLTFLRFCDWSGCRIQSRSVSLPQTPEAKPKNQSPNREL